MRRSLQKQNAHSFGFCASFILRFKCRHLIFLFILLVMLLQTFFWSLAVKNQMFNNSKPELYPPDYQGNYITFVFFFLVFIFLIEGPLVSVILPCYNGEKFIKQSVESVLSQSFYNLELIVINDGSTDASLQILNQFRSDSRFRLIDLKKNGGLPNALNIGLRNVKGHYVTWTSADNFMHEDFLQTLVEAKRTFLEASFITAKDRRGRRDVGSYPGCARDILFMWDGLAAFMWERKASSFVGEFNTEIQGAEDWNYWTRILQQFHVSLFVPKVIYTYRQHAGQMSKTLKRDYAAIEVKMSQFYLDNSPDPNTLDIWTMYPTLRFVFEKKRSMALAWNDLGLIVSSGKKSLSSVFAAPERIWRYFQKAFQYDPDFFEAEWNLCVCWARASEWDLLTSHLNQSHLPSDKLQHMKQIVENRYFKGKELHFQNPNFASERLFRLEKAWKEIYKNSKSTKNPKIPYVIAIIYNKSLGTLLGQGLANFFLYFVKKKKNKK